MFSGLKDRQTDGQTDTHAMRNLCRSLQPTAKRRHHNMCHAYTHTRHSVQRQITNIVAALHALLLLCTASALINEIFIHSSHTHPHATPLPVIHFHQIVSQTADITWQSKAVFDFIESRFSFIVTPGLDLLTNRMVWIRERGRL